MDVLDTSILVLLILWIGFRLGHSSGFEKGKTSGRISAIKELLTAQMLNGNKVVDEKYTEIPSYADAIKKIRK